jgi:hypothetical protein
MQWHSEGLEDVLNRAAHEANFITVRLF